MFSFDSISYKESTILVGIHNLGVMMGVQKWVYEPPSLRSEIDFWIPWSVSEYNEVGLVSDTTKLVRKLISNLNFEVQEPHSECSVKRSYCNFRTKMHQHFFFDKIFYETSRLIVQNCRKQLTLAVPSYSLSFMLDLYQIGGEGFFVYD